MEKYWEIVHKSVLSIFPCPQEDARNGITVTFIKGGEKKKMKADLKAGQTEYELPSDFSRINNIKIVKVDF